MSTSTYSARIDPSICIMTYDTCDIDGNSKVR